MQLYINESSENNLYPDFTFTIVLQFMTTKTPPPWPRKGNSRRRDR